METFCWLLLSDLHLKSDIDTWGQNVALRDLARDIELRLKDFGGIEFIIVKRGFKLCATKVQTQIGISGRIDCDRLATRLCSSHRTQLAVRFNLKYDLTT
ncbi:MAG: hypothetical protein ACLP9L_42040 [Thermoguttaceae bacterium]